MVAQRNRAMHIVPIHAKHNRVAENVSPLQNGSSRRLADNGTDECHKNRRDLRLHVLPIALRLYLKCERG